MLWLQVIFFLVKVISLFSISSCPVEICYVCVMSTVDGIEYMDLFDQYDIQVVFVLSVVVMVSTYIC